MNNFLNIAKKEIRELVNKQLLMSLLITVLFFVLLGSVLGKQVDGEKELMFGFLDMDKTQISQSIKDTILKEESFKLTEIEAENIEDAILRAREQDLNTLLIVPNGLEKKISEKEKAEVKIYSIIKSFSMGEMTSCARIEAMIKMINKALSQSFIKEAFPEINPENISNPISIKNFLLVKGETVEGNPLMVQSLITSQSAVIPMILMIVVIYAGMMMVNSMGLEKENKTLETLLTLPVRRSSIIGGKMAGSAVVGFLMALVYMLGFSYYMSSLIPESEGVSLTLGELGLSMGFVEYLLLGVSLFLSILVALSFSMLLGIFSKDTKSAQIMIMPLTIVVMVPFIVLMFQDIEALSPLLKIVLYIIPFTHPMLASKTLILGSYSMCLFGILYLLIVFVITVFITVRIFNTDKILTAKFSMKKFKL